MLSAADIWRKLGGTGETPSRVGQHRGPLLILGGGRTVWSDFAKVRPWKGEIMAVNDIGCHVHDVVKHWVTLHPEHFPGWRFYREAHCYGMGQKAVCHSHRVAEGVDVAWAVENAGGTSGLFACHVALMLGYEEITLAGIPMDNRGHYFDPPWQGTDFEDPAVKQVWIEARDGLFAGRIKSLSGCTRNWLGAPAWLKEAA